MKFEVYVCDDKEQQIRKYFDCKEDVLNFIEKEKLSDNPNITVEIREVSEPLNIQEFKKRIDDEAIMLSTFYYGVNHFNGGDFEYDSIKHFTD